MDKVLEICEARRRDPDFIDLCLGTSRFETASVINLGLSQKDLEDSFLYGDFRGMENLRAGLSRLYEKKLGVEVPPSRLLVTDGASGALYIAFHATLAPGDEIILPSICYPVYKILAHMVGAKCIFAPVDHRLVYDVKFMRRLITKNTKAIVVNSPSNPAMGMLTSDEISEIISFGLNIISDEVYNFLIHDGNPVTLMKLTDEHFVVNSFSKGHAAAGLRVGHAVVPERHVDAAMSIKATLNVCTSIPAQILAHKMLSSHDRIIQAHRNYLRENFAFFRDLCSKSGLKILGSPQAGFFCAVDASQVEAESTFELALQLIEREGVAVCPGTDFGKPETMFVRLNYSVPRPILSRAVRKIAPYLNAR
jgi:aspartate/methionine/tyrosine aminotransferase